MAAPRDWLEVFTYWNEQKIPIVDRGCAEAFVSSWESCRVYDYERFRSTVASIRDDRELGLKLEGDDAPDDPMDFATGMTISNRNAIDALSTAQLETFEYYRAVEDDVRIRRPSLPISWGNIMAVVAEEHEHYSRFISRLEVFILPPVSYFNSSS